MPFDEPDPLLTSNIRVLESSLPIPEIDESYSQHTGRPLLRNRIQSPLSGAPVAMTAANTAPLPRMASPGPNPLGGSAKKSKIRWHFGIRSRSEPLEVMLEIYMIRIVQMERKRETILMEA